MQTNRPETDSGTEQQLARRKQAKPLAASTDLVEYYPVEALGQGYNVYDNLDEGFDLREFLRKVHRHRWLLVTIVTVTTTVAAFVAYRAESVYQASTMLEIGKEGSSQNRSNEVLPEGDDDDKSINTKLLMFRSQELLEDVIVNLKLNQDPAFVHGESGGVSAPRRSVLTGEEQPAGATEQDAPNSGAARSSAERADLSPYVGMLEKNLKVEQIKNTRAIKITFTHTIPAVAARVADGVAQSFIERNFQGKTERFTSAQAWLDRSTAELKAKVEKAEQALADYVRNNGIFSTEGSSTLTTDKLTQLHDQVTRTETDRLLKETLYEEVRQGRVAQLPQVFAEITSKSKPELARLQDRLGELQAQEAKLSVRFGPEHPQIQEIREQIAQLRNQIESGRTDLRKELEAKLKIEYEHALENERALKAALARAKGEAVDENQAAITYSILKQDVETTTTLYKEFLQKANQSRMRLADQHSNIRVLDHAKIPLAPSGPPRLPTVLACFLLSVIVALGLIYVRETFDHTVKSSAEIARYTRLSALAVIPVIKPGEKKVYSRQVSQVGSEASRSIAEGEKGASASITASSRQMPYSAATEAYLNLRTSLLLSTAGGPPKTVLVTSGESGEGKTTTVANLALSLAQLGANVLVIDADLRRPSAHEAFGVENLHGLSTYLSGKAVLAELLQPLSYPNIFLLPSGPTPPNPANLLSSSRMQKMLEILGEHYDYILIDSPPMINLADPIVLSTMVEGVIIVARSGKTSRDVLRRLRSELTAVGANVIGVVLNQADVRPEGYYVS